ncbi:MAG: carbon-nitrogen hydrolase family protein [Oscillospiraceae bacterium]|nr:carbon-nitrogen hydrolase family protein [Oscillospiraceae bacterium]
MRIGLVSFTCKNRDISFNMSQIERALREAQGKVDLLCFGEAYLQGFDCLCWDYAVDKEMALELNSQAICQLREWSKAYGTALMTGYIEREKECLYSSCAVIDDGEILYNYRRITKGWKEYWKTDGHYREGDKAGEFTLHNHKIMLALCGDLWDCLEKFKTDRLLIWPVYVNFTVEEWNRQEMDAYARQASLAAEQVLMVNPLDHEPQNHGGSFYFRDGKIVDRLPFDQEGILVVEIADAE